MRLFLALLFSLCIVPRINAQTTALPFNSYVKTSCSFINIKHGDLYFTNNFTSISSSKGSMTIRCNKGSGAIDIIFYSPTSNINFNSYFVSLTIFDKNNTGSTFVLSSPLTQYTISNLPPGQYSSSNIEIITGGTSPSSLSPGNYFSSINVTLISK